MRFQVLSLSGGGYLGLYTAAVLAELEAQTGRRVVDMFDLLAGTSIGGIVALGLAAGVSAASTLRRQSNQADVFHDHTDAGAKKCDEFEYIGIDFGLAVHASA